MRNWVSDARFAGRMAAKTPWLTATCILALGAAMAVAIGGFSLLWSSYFARLPFEDGELIVAVRDITQPDPTPTTSHPASRCSASGNAASRPSTFSRHRIVARGTSPTERVGWRAIRLPR